VEITNAATGAFLYTPYRYYYGNDSFTFHVSDGTVTSEVATVNVEIINVPDAPVASGFSLNVAEDSELAFDLSEHASDIDSPTLSYTIISLPGHGTVTNDAETGEYTYKPDGNYNGTDYFSFRASDGDLNSNTAMCYITVDPVNTRRPRMTNRSRS
jgi:hypothetical protein